MKTDHANSAATHLFLTVPKDLIKLNSGSALLALKMTNSVANVKKMEIRQYCKGTTT